MKTWIRDVALALVIGLTLRFFVFTFVQVDGQSMEPTLRNNQFLLMEKVSLWFDGEPDYRDIVIIKDVPIPIQDENGRLIKRVIAKEGDVVEIKDGVLYLNEEKQNESYLNEKMDTDYPKTKVNKGEIFVLGDNRNQSSDSRAYGAFSLEQIEGIIMFKK